MDDILKLQEMFENGEIDEEELSFEQVEQLYDLYNKQLKEIEKDTRETVRQFANVVFELICSIIAPYCRVKEKDVRLNTLVIAESEKNTYRTIKMLREIESVFKISISADEADSICVAEDILDLVLEKKDIMKLI